AAPAREGVLPELFRSAEARAVLPAELAGLGRRAMPTAKVHRIAAAAPDDVSGIETAIRERRIDPAGIVAIFGKTEGTGLVNDFSRGFANAALIALLQRFIDAKAAAKICLVMSGGTEGAIAPHWIVLERAEGDGGARPALALGCNHTFALPPESLGRIAQVD